MGVPIIRALLLGSVLGPLVCRSSHLRVFIVSSGSWHRISCLMQVEDVHSLVLGGLTQNYAPFPLGTGLRSAASQHKCIVSDRAAIVSLVA